MTPHIFLKNGESLTAESIYYEPLSMAVSITKSFILLNAGFFFIVPHTDRITGIARDAIVRNDIYFKNIINNDSKSFSHVSDIEL